jgi:Co/Zn/Cd efflux system component
MALDAVPLGVYVETICSFLLAMPGVTDLHERDVWEMCTTRAALAAQVVFSTIGNNNTLLRAAAELREFFGFDRVINQMTCGS